jgi:hypothetical protein
MNDNLPRALCGAQELGRTSRAYAYVRFLAMVLLHRLEPLNVFNSASSSILDNEACDNSQQNDDRSGSSLLIVVSSGLL